MTENMERKLRNTFEIAAQRAPEFVPPPPQESKQRGRPKLLLVMIVAAITTVFAGISVFALINEPAQIGEEGFAETPADEVMDGPVIRRAVVSAGEPMMAGAFVGPLDLRGNCLILRDGLTVWPAGTTWDDDSQTVRMPARYGPSGEVTIGQSDLALPGGTIQIEEFRRRATDDVLRAVDDCLETTGATEVAYIG